MIRLGTVLCPVDLGPLSEPTVRLGSMLCERLGARLVLHHNLDSRPPGFLSVRWMWSEDHEDDAVRRADSAPERLRELMDGVSAPVEMEAKLTRGPFEESLRQVAEHVGADLIVMSTAGRSTAEHASLTEKVIRQAPCTVLTLGEGCDLDRFLGTLRQPPRELRVLAPVDLGPGTEQVLAFVAELADGMPHELHVLNVLEGPVVFVVMAAHTQGMWSRTREGDRTAEILHRSPCPVWFLPTAWSPSDTRRVEPDHRRV